VCSCSETLTKKHYIKMTITSWPGFELSSSVRTPTLSTMVNISKKSLRNLQSISLMR
jgi:hypothetical protein